MPTPPLDLFAIDGLLDDEERAIRDTVRRFGDDRLRPYVAEWFESGEVPARDLAKELGALGLLGMHLQGYGCAGTSVVAYGMACHELEAVDSGLRSLVSVQGSLAMFAIHRYGSEEQKQAWLPAMAAGEAIGCFGLTEPDAGSDPGAMRTSARRDGDDWVLDGDQAVDHQRQRRRRRGRLGAHRRRHPRLRGADGDAGLHRQHAAPQALAPRLGELRAGARRRAAARRRDAARGAGSRRAADLPVRGAAGHRLRRARGRPRQPGGGARVRRPSGRSSASRSPATRSPRPSSPT